MESNKDEALRCISISRHAFAAGDKTRAWRFLHKAKKLYPDLKDENLQLPLDEDAGQKTARGDQATESDCRGISENNVGNSSENNENCFLRQRNASEMKDLSEVVRRIGNTKDYYEILGLARDCSQIEIRKAFRQLSLKVHPDKNNLPGAEEAFKAVSTAFNCLSNPELRRKYDNENRYEEHEFTNDEYTGEYKSHAFWDETCEPSELFTNFFVRMNQQNATFQGPHFFRSRRTSGEATGSSFDKTRILHFVGLVQLLVVVMLVLVSLMPKSKPSFSLRRDGLYQYECLTSKHGVSFFIKNPDCDQRYPMGSNIRKTIDNFVEKEHRQTLAHNCRVEVGLRMWGRTEETPSCDALRQFGVQSD